MKQSTDPTAREVAAHQRSVTVRDAIRDGWQGEFRDRRDDLILVAGQQPALFRGNSAADTAVDAWVHLYRDKGKGVLEEIPVDPHRILVNPPTCLVTVPEELDEDGNVVTARQTRSAPAEAFTEALWESVLTNPNPAGWRTRGTVTTVFSSTADGHLVCNAPDPGGTYTNARENTGGAAVTVDNSSTTFTVGQQQPSAPPRCWEGFVSFDTSSIADSDAVTIVTLDLWLVTDASGTDFTVQARTKDWGATLTSADYSAGSTLSGLTLLATLASSGIGSTGAYKTCTSQAAFLTATNLKTGVVYVILSSDRQSAGNAPSSSEFLIFSSADETGTTQDPKLTITHNALVYAPPPPSPPPNRIWRVFS